MSFSKFRRFRLFIGLLLACGFVATLSLAQNSARKVGGTLRSPLLPIRDVRLDAEVSGIVKEYLIEEGDRVSKGDIIVELRSEEEKLRVALANANLEAAQAEFDRAEKSLKRIQLLSQQGIPSEKDIEMAVYEADRAKAALQQGQSSLRLAEVQAEKKVVRSPIDGLFLKSYKQPGESVNDFETVARVLDVSTLEMIVYAGSEYWGRFHAGESIEVELTSGPAAGRKVMGQVSFVDGIIDPAASTFRVKIGIPPSEDIVVGLSARIVVD